MRQFRHLLAGPWTIRRHFPQAALDAITSAVAAAERTHGGQIRVAIEGGLPPWMAARMTTRQRALDVFSLLRVWDTERNNGVLIYLLLAERKVEIVADRGAHARVGDAGWAAVCRSMETLLAVRRYREAVLDGVQGVGALLAIHFPPTGAGTGNELPDRPAIL